MWPLVMEANHGMLCPLNLEQWTYTRLIIKDQVNVKPRTATAPELLSRLKNNSYPELTKCGFLMHFFFTTHLRMMTMIMYTLHIDCSENYVYKSVIIILITTNSNKIVRIKLSFICDR